MFLLINFIKAAQRSLSSYTDNKTSLAVFSLLLWQTRSLFSYSVRVVCFCFFNGTGAQRPVSFQTFHLVHRHPTSAIVLSTRFLLDQPGRTLVFLSPARAFRTNRAHWWCYRAAVFSGFGCVASWSAPSFIQHHNNEIKETCGFWREARSCMNLMRDQLRWDWSGARAESWWADERVINSCVVSETGSDRFVSH